MKTQNLNYSLLVAELADLIPYPTDFGSVNGLGFLDMDEPFMVKNNGYSVIACSVACDGDIVVVADDEGNQYEVDDTKAVNFINKKVTNSLKKMRKFHPLSVNW